MPKFLIKWEMNTCMFPADPDQQGILSLYTTDVKEDEKAIRPDTRLMVMTHLYTTDVKEDEKARICISGGCSRRRVKGFVSPIRMRKNWLPG